MEVLLGQCRHHLEIFSNQICLKQKENTRRVSLYIQKCHDPSIGVGPEVVNTSLSTMFGDAKGTPC